MHQNIDLPVQLCKDCEQLREHPGSAAHGALTVSREGGFDLLYQCTRCGFGWKRYTQQHSLEGQWLVVPRERHHPWRPHVPPMARQGLAAAM
jgi:hypothetical protein